MNKLIEASFVITSLLESGHTIVRDTHTDATEPRLQWRDKVLQLITEHFPAWRVEFSIIESGFNPIATRDMMRAELKKLNEIQENIDVKGGER